MQVDVAGLGPRFHHFGRTGCTSNRRATPAGLISGAVVCSDTVDQRGLIEVTCGEWRPIGIL